MKNSLHYFPLVVFIILSTSCGKKSKTKNSSESELVNLVNAVQEQIMVQGNISEEEEQVLLGLCNIISHDDGLSNFNPEDRMVLKDVELVPIYEGCEGLTKDETRACFKAKVNAFIKREFNVEVSKKLNLSDPKQVDVFFIIDKNGAVSGLKVRDSDVSVQGEILRVLRKLPVMTPAIHNGQQVSVLCSAIITYGNDIDVEVVYIPEQ